MKKKIKTVFPSRTDPFFTILAWITPTAFSLFAAYRFVAGGQGAVPMLGVALFTSLLIAGLIYPCRYTIKDTNLKIRAGIFRYTIPIENIEDMKMEWNTLAAPTLSFHRIRLRLRNGEEKLISPQNRDQFIKTIEELHIKAVDPTATSRRVSP